MECAAGITNPCPNNLSGISSHLFLTLINTLMASQCALSPQGRYPPNYGSQIRDAEEFDFVIIGAGSAGAVIANRLSEVENWKVLLLEAGDYPSAQTEIPSLLFSLQGTEEDWQYTTEPSDNYCLGMKDGRCTWPRGKVLGGSSSINAMIYIRGNKQDFDNWAVDGNTGWDYDSVDHYFKKAENVKGTPVENNERYGKDGFLSTSSYKSGQPLVNIIREAAQEYGYFNYTDKNPLGYMETLMTIKDGTRISTAKAYLATIKDRKNLHVVTKAHVMKILIDPATKTASGVKVTMDGKDLKIFAKKEVILSAGTINSPQLLMLSGIGPRNHLENLGINVIHDLSVGENLQDHQIFLGFDGKIDKSAVIEATPHQLLDAIYQYFLYRQGPMAEISATNLVGFINTKGDSEYPNIQFHHIIFDKNDNFLLNDINRCANYVEDIHKAKVANNRESATFQILPTLLNPKSRGKILLRSSDPSEKPLIYPNYFGDEDDLETFLEAIKYAKKLLETEAFSAHNPKLVDFNLANCKGFVFDTDDYWRCALRSLGGSIYHPVGTCKMGPSSDTSAVVDPKLRVHGVKQLRVIDASVMPKIVSANTNAAVVLIAEKGADMIKEDWLPVVHNEL